ncbi:MAG: hypothetical protein K5641_07615 [Lachnospiraceae bacterium]|nr:hypothetical protein [Lachnospiraceae bacterium]
MNKFCKVFSVCLVVSLFIAALWHATGVLEAKDECGKNKQLVSGDDQYDVFLLGSSHTGNLQPIELWQQGGITSYNIYNSGAGMSRYLATLELALDYKKPKLVVIDTDQWWAESTFEEEPGDYHRTFDIFPLSLHKIQVVRKYVPDTGAQFELLFDLFRYHSRYHELEAVDFADTDDSCLGAHLHFASIPQDPPSFEAEAPEPDPELEEETQTLRQVIELCRSKDIDVMLMCLPFCASESALSKQQYIYNLAEEYDITFCNFFDRENVLNWKTDFKDGGHLNLSGARKLTPILIDEIRKNYGIEDHRSDPAVADRWNAKVVAYYSFMDSFVGTSEGMDLKEMLIMMSLPHYCGEVFLKNAETGFLNRRGAIDLLQNITYCELPGAKEAALKGENYLLVYNRLAGVVQEYHGNELKDMLDDDMEDALVTLRDAGTMEVAVEYRENPQ